jgi:hypothetical protein
MQLFFSLRVRSPSVFSPKVTPDPSDTERLEARLREAAERLANRYDRDFLRRARRQFSAT